VARVTHSTSGCYQVAVTGTEFALVKNALDEARRVSRFGIEVLDKADQAGQAEPAKTSRLQREIEALEIREASLSSLRKTMAEVYPGGDAAARCADSGTLSS
jgi:hypothetical protein